MIKKLVVALLLALPLAGFAQKFAVVNTQEVMQALPEVKSAQTQLQDSQKKYDEEGQKLSREFQTKLAELDSLQKVQGTPQSVIERRAQDLETLQRRIQEFQYTASQELERQQASLLQPIYSKVSDAITILGQEGGYLFVFDAAQPLYTNPAQVDDITAKVKTRLIK